MSRSRHRLGAGTRCTSSTTRLSPTLAVAIRVARVGHTLVATDPGSADYPAAASALAGWPRSLRRRTGSEAPATAGRICSPTAGSTAGTRPRPPATWCRPRSCGSAGQGHATVALAFGRNADAALAGARASLHAASAPWRTGMRPAGTVYVAHLRRPPASLRTATAAPSSTGSRRWCSPPARTRRYRGAYVASPSSPWAFGRDDPSGPYHLVWSRDLYQIASSLSLAGDRAGANRALDFLFDGQQKPDGSFPQNSRRQRDAVLGRPAARRGRRCRSFWPTSSAARTPDLGAREAGRRLPRSSFSQDGNRAPWTRRSAGRTSPATPRDDRGGDRRPGLCRADRPGERRHGVRRTATSRPPTPGRRTSRAGP